MNEREETKIKAIDLEVERFVEMVNDYRKRAIECDPYDTNATKESSALKSTYKAMKYKLDKLIL